MTRTIAKLKDNAEKIWELSIERDKIIELIIKSNDSKELRNLKEQRYLLEDAIKKHIRNILNFINQGIR